METAASKKHETITVVTGLPRSGTSMMMQMLAAGGLPPWTDEVRGLDADNPNGYYECERVKSLARDNSWLTEAKGHAIKIVVPLLPNLASGNYHLLFMERDLDEVIRSQAEMLKRGEKKGGRLSSEQLASAFQKQLRSAQNLIQSEEYPVLFVKHRSCVQDPLGIVGEVNRFLGGNLNEAAMAAVVDESLYRQRVDT